MSIALAPALSPSATPNPSRAERLHDLLNRFAVEARAEGTLLGDAQGFLVAGSDRFDGAEGELAEKVKVVTDELQALIDEGVRQRGHSYF